MVTIPAAEKAMGASPLPPSGTWGTVAESGDRTTGGFDPLVAASVEGGVTAAAAVTVIAPLWPTPPAAPWNWQWKGMLPAVDTTTDFDEPGLILPVSNAPLSAVAVWGKSLVFLNTIVVPAETENEAGLNVPALTSTVLDAAPETAIGSMSRTASVALAPNSAILARRRTSWGVSDASTTSTS